MNENGCKGTSTPEKNIWYINMNKNLWEEKTLMPLFHKTQKIFSLHNWLEQLIWRKINYILKHPLRYACVIEIYFHGAEEAKLIAPYPNICFGLWRRLVV
jgi:hypothetical protein